MKQEDNGKVTQEDAEHAIKCPFCKKNFLVANLMPVQGAELFALTDGKLLHQTDYFCPDCQKVILCDTKG